MAEKDVSDKDVFIKMLENFNEVEIFELAKQVSEKHLDKDSEMYKFFHDKNNIGLEEED